MRLALPVRDDILMGEVTHCFESRAIVSLVKRNGVDVYSPFNGEIRISNVTRRYINSMRDALSQGDIIRAVALNTHQISVELSLVGHELGVVFAKCIKCGGPLTQTSHNNMICLRCENRETREVANDYGVAFGLETRPDLAPRRRSYSDQRYDDKRPMHGGKRRYSDRRDSGRRNYRQDSRGQDKRRRY